MNALCNAFCCLWCKKLEIPSYAKLIKPVISDVIIPLLCLLSFGSVSNIRDISLSIFRRQYDYNNLSASYTDWHMALFSYSRPKGLELNLMDSYSFLCLYPNICSYSQTVLLWISSVQFWVTQISSQHRICQMNTKASFILKFIHIQNLKCSFSIPSMISTVVYMHTQLRSTNISKITFILPYSCWCGLLVSWGKKHSGSHQGWDGQSVFLVIQKKTGQNYCKISFYLISSIAGCS